MKSILRVESLALCVVLLAACGARASAQQSWTKTPFQQWSKADAERLLSDSPWAKAQEVRIRYAAQKRAVAGASGSMIQSGENTATLGGAEAPVDFTFTLRLRSSLPVRQALVRLKQLEAKYDNMSEKERATFDAKMKGMLDCPACAQNYVLTLSSKSKNSPGADAVYALFKGARFDDIKRYIFLANERGERRELAHFVPPHTPGEEAVFFFNRFDERGAPLLTPANREVVFNLTNNEINSVTNFRIDVSTLVTNGTVDF